MDNEILKDTIDVIIPCYNAEKYIEFAVNSILNQTLLPNRIIIVNDGSTDNSKKIIDGLIIKNTSNVDLTLINQVNKGLSTARNIGISYSNSEYVAFLDADDYWYPEKLEQQLFVFRTSKYDKVGVVYCAHDIIDLYNNKTNEYLISLIRDYVKGDVYPYLLKANYVISSGSGVLIKRECFGKSNWFDVNLNAFEDWDMWLRISENYQFDYSNNCLVSIRRHPFNMQKNKNHMLKNQISFFNKHVLKYSTYELKNLWAYRFSTIILEDGYDKNLWSILKQNVNIKMLNSISFKTLGSFRLYLLLRYFKLIFEKKSKVLKV